jgi:hypothetical protein
MFQWSPTETGRSTQKILRHFIISGTRHHADDAAALFTWPQPIIYYGHLACRSIKTRFLIVLCHSWPSQKTVKNNANIMALYWHRDCRRCAWLWPTSHRFRWTSVATQTGIYKFDWFAKLSLPTATFVTFGKKHKHPMPAWNPAWTFSNEQITP